MHYLIYKTTCIINGKYYIGKHKTKNRDDDYFGSGKLLKRAIAKYGRENFVREIILECSSEEEMNLAERIMIVPDAETNYNLCPGGQGGWGYINTSGSNIYGFNGQNGAIEKAQEIHRFKLKNDPDYRLNNAKNARKGAQRSKELYPHSAFHGKKHCNDTKVKIGLINSKKQKGSRNSQFGTCWMTDGATNIKIKRDEVDRWAEMGYRRGRIIGVV